MTVEEIAARFQAEKTATGWIARCPAHDDQEPSLSITEGDDGRTLVYCHAGCTFEQIVAASGLKKADFSPPKSITPKANPTPKAPTPGALAISKGAPAKSVKEVASYIYVNEQGALRYRVVRYEPKTFKFCRPDPEHPGKWIWNLDGERRLLYHLDKIQGEKAVALAEGEKDADRLIAEGVLATTNSGGCKAWTPEHAEQLKAAGVVVAYVLPDADAPGAEWASKIRETCIALGMAVVVCHLDERPGLEPGWDVSDWLDAGGTVEDLRLLLRVAALGAARSLAGPLPQPADPEPDLDVDVPKPAPLPRIVPKGLGLAELSGVAWGALLHANEPPIVFKRGDAFVRLAVEQRTGLAVVRYLDRARLRNRLTRVADWKKEDSAAASSVYPPSELLDDMLTDDEVVVPLLERIVECPVFLPDGRLMTEPGYDAASGVLYRPPAGFVVPPVPAAPSVDDVTKARKLVLEIFCDFPFVGQADRAAVVALLLAAFAREMIDGNCPLTLIEKPSPRTGASLIADSIGYVLYGRAIEKMSEVVEESEWRKRITALLLNAPPLIVLDNLRKRLDSGALSACLTTGWWLDRVLGESRTVKLPARCLWVATANNPRVSNEIAGRIVPCRLDPKVERPGDRDPSLFAHPRLLAWILNRRSEIVWSCLTLIRRWLADGRPAGAGRLGGFESWCETMGGILASAGVPGLLENLEQFRARADDDTTLLKAFLTAWLALQGQKAVRAKELVPLADDAGLDIEAKTEQAKALRLGKMLKAEEDRRYSLGGVMVAVKSEPDPHTKTKMWMLAVMDEAAGNRGESRGMDVTGTSTPRDGKHAEVKDEVAASGELRGMAGNVPVSTRESEAARAEDGGEAAAPATVGSETPRNSPHSPQPLDPDDARWDLEPTDDELRGRGVQVGRA